MKRRQDILVYVHCVMLPNKTTKQGCQMPTAVNLEQGVMLAYIMVPTALKILLLALTNMSTNTWMIGFCSRASMNIK